MAAPKAPKAVVSIPVADFVANYKGAYSATGVYVPGDYVTEEEGTYVCVRAVTGYPPTESKSIYWVLVGAD